jgi:hypothetical protein
MISSTLNFISQLFRVDLIDFLILNRVTVIKFLWFDSSCHIILQKHAILWIRLHIARTASSADKVGRTHGKKERASEFF